MSSLTLFIDELPNPKERETGYTFSKLTNSNCVKDWKTLHNLFSWSLMKNKERNLFSYSSLEMHFEKRKFFFNIKNFKIYFKEKKKKPKLTIITHNY